MQEVGGEKRRRRGQSLLASCSTVHQGVKSFSCTKTRWHGDLKAVCHHKCANFHPLMELCFSKRNVFLRDFTTLLKFLVSKLWEPGKQPGNTEHAVLFVQSRNFGVVQHLGLIICSGWAMKIYAVCLCCTMIAILKCSFLASWREIISPSLKAGICNLKAILFVVHFSRTLNGTLNLQ